MVASKNDVERHEIALRDLGSVEFVFNDDEIVRLLRAAIEQRGGSSRICKAPWR